MILLSRYRDISNEVYISKYSLMDELNTNQLILIIIISEVGMTMESTALYQARILMNEKVFF